MRPKQCKIAYLICVGKKLADKRHALGEKEYTVAKAVGLGRATLSKIESGCYNSLKLITICKLATYLQIPLTELLNDLP